MTGQFAFIRRYSQPLTQKRLHTLVNLPQMNHLLYKCRMHSVDEMYSATDREHCDKILKQWIPHGVVQGEVGASTTHAHNEAPQERLINLIITGRVSTYITITATTFDLCSHYYMFI